MTRNFCTYFDKNYLLRGLALYRSLLENCNDFQLWILCFDEQSHSLLKKLNLDKVRLIQLYDFEDEKLLVVKKTRSAVEYYWTCTPSLLLYILKNNSHLDSITYLDADLFFYNSVGSIFNELGDSSIMIIAHNFSKDQEWREKTSGKYNVGMVYFKNDYDASECLNWWRKKCLEWCYGRYDNGKLGDQLYLNDWPERFKNVYILKNLGADVASWNVRNYNFYKTDEKIFLKDKKSGDIFPLIFYHFHGVKMHDLLGKVVVRRQNTNGNMNALIFSRYSKTLTECLRVVKKVDQSFKFGLDNVSSYLYWKIKSVFHKLKN